MKVDVWCYSDAPRPDAVTARIASMVPHFVDCSGWSDEALAQRIRADNIDILVDLAGHTGRNRLLVFARKPAPVQASWLGYFNTTGLLAIDYRIADRISVPEGSERLFVEQLQHMPRSANCYQPPTPSPAPAPAPSIKNGYVTFGCYNNPAKISREVVRTFASILRAVDSSRMVLKYGTFADPGMRTRYLEWFAEDGISEERIILHTHSSMTDFLASFAEIDIALDPFPYSGETTALHTLWMGVPLVALEGESLVQRLGSRVLRIAGLPEWVATTKDAYVRIAVAAATNLPMLVAQRSQLRECLQRSPFLDHAGFTHELETAFEEMWRQKSLRA